MQEHNHMHDENCSHSHEHNHQPLRMIKSKFQEAFDNFAPAPSMEQVQLELKKIFDTYYDQLYTPEMVNLIHACIDLTSLEPTDDEDSIYNFVQKVNELDESNPSVRPVASICVYPNFVRTVKEHLMVEGVHVTSVAGGFPAAQTYMEVKVAEIGLAIADGADEIDIVLPIGAFLNGNYDEVKDQLDEQREACHGRTLKVILETGALQTPENIQRASIMSLFCGADFIKTSTGKGYPGATFEACYLMALVLRAYQEKYGKKCGLKLSGGIRTTDDAVKYLCIVKAVLGDEWLDPSLLRFGASSLEGSLLKILTK